MATPSGFRPLIAGAGVCLALGLAVPAAAQVDLARAQIVTLTNGLRVLLVPDSTAVAVEVSSWFDAGTGNEPPGRPGITHVIERLVSRGTAGGERAGRVAAEGGLAGSITLPDAVCFYETLPAGALELGIRIAAERLKPLAVTAADLDAERARLRDERRSDGGPAARGLQRLYAALYPAGPARPPVPKPDADLARITARDCEDDFLARFAPNRALVTVVGRFAPDRALDLARTWLQPAPRRPGPPARPPVAAAARERRVTEPLDFELRLVFIGWRAPARSTVDAVPLDLLGRVLASGSEARLRDAVGPGHELLIGQAGYDGRRERGQFFIYGALGPGVDSAAVEKDLIARIGKLAAEPVATEELERVKRQAESAALFAWQTVHGRTAALGAAQLVEGDFHGAWRQLDRIRAASAVDLQRAAARLMKTEARSVVWLVPSAPARPAPGAQGGR